MNGPLRIGSVPIWQIVTHSVAERRLSKLSKDDNMTVLARRFSIISLVLMIFAFLMADAVHKNKAARSPYLTGELFVCTTGNEPVCGANNTFVQK